MKNKKNVYSVVELIMIVVAISILCALVVQEIHLEPSLTFQRNYALINNSTVLFENGSLACFDSSFRNGSWYCNIDDVEIN
mgnify:CR=1 FL=1